MKQALTPGVSRLVAIDLIAFIVLAAAAGTAAGLALAGVALLLSGSPVPL